MMLAKAARASVKIVRRQSIPALASHYHSWMVKEGHHHEGTYEENFDLKGSSLFDSHRRFQSSVPLTSPDVYDVIMSSHSPVSSMDCYRSSTLSKDSIRDIMAAQEEWDQLREDTAFELMKEDPFLQEMEDNWKQFHLEHDITQSRTSNGDYDIEEDCVQTCIH